MWDLRTGAHAQLVIGYWFPLQQYLNCGSLVELQQSFGKPLFYSLSVSMVVGKLVACEAAALFKMHYPYARIVKK